MRVECILAVCETPRLFFVGFLHRADKGSHAALRDQSQRVADLCAACSEIVFIFGLTRVSQLLRDWTDESHVDQETEAEVLVLSIGTTKTSVACPDFASL